MGCVSQVGEQGWNIGRMAPLVAGWPETVPGTTVDRQCGSSMQCNFNAAAAVRSGQLELVVAAGVESMSRVPMGSSGGDLSPELLERWEIVPQGISAELIAEEWGLSREQLDAYSYESHRRALAAIEEGRFEREVVPVEVSNPHAGVLFGVDETPRADTSPEALAGIEAGVPPRGEGDRRELEPDLRRRSRGARRERGRLLEARAGAACPLRLVRPRRSRSAADAARQPAGVRARARTGRPLLGRHRRRRGERGLRLGRAPVHARRRARGALGATSTRTAAASRSATRSARRARG